MTPRAAGGDPPHALVIGAGLVGLAVAHALGVHLERVTLVERGDLPDRSGPVGAVPSNGHARLLRRILASPPVVVRAGLEATGLVVDGRQVCGVEVRPRAAFTMAATGTTGAAAAPIVRPPFEIGADLVVDATGLSRDSLVDVYDGLIVIGPPGGPAPGPARRADRADDVAAEIERLLARHLTRHRDLRGFSGLAQAALARTAGARTAGAQTGGAGARGGDGDGAAPWAAPSS